MMDDRPAAAEEQDTLERFLVQGEVPDILTGDRLAWQSLEEALGGDDPKAWWLAEMTHAFIQKGTINFNAVFKRDQSFPTPQIIGESEEIRESRERAAQLYGEQGQQETEADEMSVSTERQE